MKHITEFGAVYNDPLASSVNVTAWKDMISYAQTGKPVSLKCSEGEVLYGCQDGTNAWAFLVPSNVTIDCRHTKLALASGAGSWTRLLSIGKGGVISENIKIFGDISADGSVGTISPSNNEHMHSVFIFNVHGLEIDEVAAVDSRGDNVFIGGDSETGMYSDDVLIHSIRAKKAGRKNLVWGFANRVRIGTANLDNTLGGAACYGGTADETDKHSLDIEPDNYLGTNRFSMHIGSMGIRGSGVDGGSSLKLKDADDFKLTVGDMVLDFVPNGAVMPWVHNGGMISVDTLNVRGLDKPMTIGYGAKLSAREATLSGNVADALVRVQGTAPNKPSVHFGHLSVENSGLYGVRVLGGDVDIGYMEASTPAAPVVLNETNVSAQSVASNLHIGHLHTRNSGDSSVVSLVGKTGIKSYVNIPVLTVEDTRAPLPPRIVYVGDTSINAGLKIGKINNPSGIPEYTYGF